MGPYPRGGALTEASILELRAAIRSALDGVSLANAAALSECSENTIYRILRGENVNIRTAARIAEALGYQLSITVSKKPQDVAVTPR